jgi:NAD(P)-dependent dehydrogenase (short-subunit alcohol dehydrogenase family)
VTGAPSVLLGRFGSRSHGRETLAADVTDPAVRVIVAEWAEGANYRINSAGVIVIKPILDLTVEDWRRVQTVNAEATFFLCQQVGPRRVPGGAIVNLSSSSDNPLNHPFLRLCSRLAAGEGQRRPAGHRLDADAGGSAGESGADARTYDKGTA